MKAEKKKIRRKPSGGAVQKSRSRKAANIEEGNFSDSSKSKSRRKKSLGGRASANSPLRLGLRFILSIGLLALVLGSIVLIDVSFLHVEKLAQKQTSGSEKIHTRAKRRLEALSVTKTSSTDIVSEAISDLDSIITKTRKKHSEDTEKLSRLRGESILGGFNEQYSGNQRKIERVLKCRKKGDSEDKETAASEDAEGSEENSDIENTQSDVEDGGFSDVADASVTGCGPDEEEYFLDVVEDIEPDAEDFALAGELGIDKKRFSEILNDATSNIQERRGKLGGLNMRADGFDLKGVSSVLSTDKLAFSNLLEMQSEKSKKGKKKDGKKSSSGTNAADKIKIEGENLSRELVLESRPPSEEFQKFVAQLRGKTYSHFSKKSDTERGLKELGYKQATKKATKDPTWNGFEGLVCPNLRKASMQISFCAHYMQEYKEHEQFGLMKLFSKSNPGIPLGPVDSFFPETWRLYKIEERRNLKARCANNSLSFEGGPYVTKYTVSSSAGLTLGMWEKLKHSDHSTQTQIKEVKNKVIVQLYINNPYLFEKRKFIIRTYVAIVSNEPMIVYYSEGALYRSISNFAPFTKRDGNYHRAAHFTNDQKSHSKGPLKSSLLYSSLGMFEQWLKETGREEEGFMDKLRSRLKAMVIYALYALMRPAMKEFVKSYKLPKDVAVIQPACFDFLLDDQKKLWYLGANSGSHCFVNMGGNSFRPSWKQKLRNSVTDQMLKLSEEILWRKVEDKPISSMYFTTKMDMDVLIDETFPDWDYTEEINDHLAGKIVAQDRANGNSDEGSEPEASNEEGGTADVSEESNAGSMETN